MKDDILVRGAKVHNLKNMNVDIPLNELVAISGLSGFGIRRALRRRIASLLGSVVCLHTSAPDANSGRKS